MANRLEMAKIQAIHRLQAAQWSQRRIARALGIDRGTVRRYWKRRSCGAKAAISPPGSEAPKAATFSAPPGQDAAGAGCAEGTGENGDSKPAISPTGCEGLGDGRGGSKAAISPPGSQEAASLRPGRRSHCEPYQEIILAKLELELSAQRIFQDLRDEHGFAGTYDSVKRFVRRLGRDKSLPLRRMECEPGDEAQVDFGTGAPVITPEGKRRRPWIFRLVLSHSRKGYTEATYRQTTEDFIRCLENAFWQLGGVPQTLVIDNLRAAVKQPDWFDPELVPKLEAFCRHYGTVILPTRPRMPRHKGKVESGVKYAKNNGLKGRTFTSLEEQNQHLARWEAGVADTRIHGTTKRQVAKVFAEVERPTLLPLPRERFPFFHEGRRKVNRDGHIEVAKAYYTAPPEYLARTVWVRWDARLVRIFNRDFEQIAVHVRQEPGRFSTNPQHIAREKVSGLERGAEYLLKQARQIGPQSHAWAQAMLTARGIQGTRVPPSQVTAAKSGQATGPQNGAAVDPFREVFDRLGPLDLPQRHNNHQPDLVGPNMSGLVHRFASLVQHVQSRNGQESELAACSK